MAKKRFSQLSSTRKKGYIAVDDATLGTGKMLVQDIYNMIADEFEDNVTNAVKDEVYWHEAKLYRAKENYNGVWDASKFVEAPVNEVFAKIARYINSSKYKGFLTLDDADGTGKFEITSLFSSIAPVYDSTKSYSAGEFVMYKGELYQLSYDNPVGSFQTSKATKIPVAKFLDYLQTQLCCYRSNEQSVAQGTGTINLGLGMPLYKAGEKLRLRASSSDSFVSSLALNVYSGAPEYSGYGALSVDGEWHEFEALDVSSHSFIFQSGSQDFPNAASVKVEIIRYGEIVNMLRGEIDNLHDEIELTKNYVAEYVTKEVGNDSGDYTLTEKINIIPDASTQKYRASSDSYDSFIIKLNGSDENPIPYSVAGAEAVACVYSDEYPVIGNDSGAYKSKSGDCNKKYLVILVSLPCDSVSVSVGKTGVFEKIEETKSYTREYVGQPLHVATLTEKIGMIPDSSTQKYRASSASYDSFIVQVDGTPEKPVPYTITSTSFVGCVYDDNYPSIGNSSGEFKQRSGKCDKKYIVILVSLPCNSIDIFVGNTGVFEIGYRKKLKVLFIGNSVCQDHVMYLPWVLKNVYPDIEYKIACFYHSGYNINDYVTNVITGEVNSEIYSIADNVPNWTNDRSGVSLIDALQSDDWDIISIQGFYTHIHPTESAEDINTFIDWLRSNCVGPFELGWFMHQTYESSDPFNTFEKIVDGAVLASSLGATIIFPAGIANELVKGVVQQSTMTADNIHNQDGFPCILGAYAVASAIAKRKGKCFKILGNKKRISSYENTQLSVAGSNGTFQAGTSSDWEAIQIAAEKSVNATEYIISFGGKSVIDGLLE